MKKLRIDKGFFVEYLTVVAKLLMVFGVLMLLLSGLTVASRQAWASTIEDCELPSWIFIVDLSSKSTDGVYERAIGCEIVAAVGYLEGMGYSWPNKLTIYIADEEAELVALKQRYQLVQFNRSYEEEAAFWSQVRALADPGRGLKPVIIINDMNGWKEGSVFQRREVLAHELTHIAQFKKSCGFLLGAHSALVEAHAELVGMRFANQQTNIEWVVNSSSLNGIEAQMELNEKSLLVLKPLRIADWNEEEVKRKLLELDIEGHFFAYFYGEYLVKHAPNVRQSDGWGLFSDYLKPFCGYVNAEKQFVRTYGFSFEQSIEGFAKYFMQQLR